MSEAGAQVSQPANPASTDLWKFFEERGANQKDSMFKLFTWIIGFAAVVLAFAFTEGFEKGFETVKHPWMLCMLSGVGLVVVLYAAVVVYDHGRHIDRTFARADAARGGKFDPQEIWQAGKNAEQWWRLPPICWELLFLIFAFAAAFAYCANAGLRDLRAQPEGKRIVAPHV
jgi:hypothetical protein